MRLLVPILAIVVAVAFIWAIASSDTGKPPIPEDPPTTPSADLRDTDDPGLASGPFDGEPADDVVPDTPADAPSPAADASRVDADAEKATESIAELGPLHAVGATHAPAVALGSTDDDSPFRMKVQFTSYGAGIQKIQLSAYNQYVDPPAEGEQPEPYTLVDAMHGLAEDAAPQFYPYAARGLNVNGKPVNSTITLNSERAVVTERGIGGIRWQTDPVERTDDRQSVTYRLPIHDANDQPVLELVRTWTVTADSYDLQLEQHLENKTDAPLEVYFSQYGQGDVLTDLGAYLGDRRMFITGYFREQNPPKFEVHVHDTFVARTKLIKDKQELWPSDKLNEKQSPRLAWIAAENRYFALITHTPVPDTAQSTAEVPEFDTVFPSIDTVVFEQPNVTLQHADEQRLAVVLDSGKLSVGPNQSRALDLGIYAGPRESELLAEPPYSLLDFGKLIRYELGCTWCTFQWLAKLLLGYLEALHWLVKDWGVAIIILVLTVRLILHPITKRAQTNMMKMSKQMGALQPEIQKLKEKHKEDPAALNREMMALYREKGINPANMLGCLPMLLQTPIWIALYAMLYFAIELRHEPAFYGIFQAISGGNWHFLEDLSVSDNFIRFIPPDQPAYKLTWLPIIEPEFRSLNILPLLMAVVFFFQMKLTTPPPQNDQQKQQQMIMKIMPFMFPIFLYSAPAGLTLYICASTLAGIVDSYIVRKHIREQEEAGTLFDKKEVKPGGFRDRLQKRFELAQQMANERQREMQQNQRGSSGNKRERKKRR